MGQFQPSPPCSPARPLLCPPYVPSAVRARVCSPVPWPYLSGRGSAGSQVQLGDARASGGGGRLGPGAPWPAAPRSGLGRASALASRRPAAAASECRLLGGRRRPPPPPRPARAVSSSAAGGRPARRQGNASQGRADPGSSRKQDLLPDSTRAFLGVGRGWLNPSCAGDHRVAFPVSPEPGIYWCGGSARAEILAGCSQVAATPPAPR